jgi:hypothetical protein
MMLWFLKRFCGQLHPVKKYALDGNVILIVFAEPSAIWAVWWTQWLSKRFLSNYFGCSLSL